jgi:hypothetical protein
MGRQFPRITDRQRAFIAEQKLFFVATAAPKGRVNVSPKGLPTLRVLGPSEVAYLDLTGSGSETRAHLLASDDRRLTIMFCSFEGSPLILRLYGRGRSLMRGTAEYDRVIQEFDEMPGARQIVHLAVELVQESCGMGVPLFDYREDRRALSGHWARRREAGIKRYWGLTNARSVDGFPTAFDPEVMASRRAGLDGGNAPAAYQLLLREAASAATRRLRALWQR